MADDHTDPPAAPQPTDFLAQMTAMTARLWGFEPPSSTATDIPAIPQLGSLSAQQFQAMVTTIKAQRQSIAALHTQLQAFDEHLATLQKILEPLLAWSTSWAALEKQTGLHPAPGDNG